MDQFNLREYLKNNPLLKENIEFIDYVIVDQDEFKAQYDKHYDDYGDDEEFVEEFGGDFLSPNIDAINQYYGDRVHADDVIEDFYIAGGIENISSNEEFEAWLDKNREFYLAENKTLNEDLSPKFMNKYLSEFNAEDFEIEDIESYSDRDKAIFAYLEIGPGIIVKDEVAKAIKDKSGEEIIQYFQDKNYSYMPYSEMRRIFKVAPVQGMVWDESGAKDTPWYFYPNHVRKLNKIWRTKYPELNIPKLKYEFKSAITDDLEELYRGQARQQKGQDLEISYEEYADAFADGVKDRMELSGNDFDNMFKGSTPDDINF